MQKCIIEYLEDLGYTVNEKAFEIIGLSYDWYCNNVASDFHTRTTVQGEPYTLMPLGMGKRVCADEANLCEYVEINTDDIVLEVLNENRFDVMYRQLLEETTALGTTGAYISLKNADLLDDGTIENGTIRINYVNANGIIPLTVINKEVVECAFAGQSLYRGTNIITLVIFTQGYNVQTVRFNLDGNIISESEPVYIGKEKPFAIMEVAEVNNIDYMDGYGLPKLYGAIPFLKGLDLAYNIFLGDLDKGEKIVLVNELLCKFDKYGNPIYPNEQIKKMFLMLGEKLPEEKGLVTEINPEIRVNSIKESMEFLLSMLSLQFGFGSKKYTFDNGQIQTATQYIGERQDAMQELNKQRGQAKQFITELVKGIASVSNLFNKTNILIDEVVIDFDDSYIEDRVSKLESMRADALAFGIPKLTEWYICEKYNLTEEEYKELEQEQEVNEENYEVE
jgi:hypothetical protein